MVSYKVYTNIGNREVNEDSVGVHVKDEEYCFVLADGLGGHGKGECASAMAVETVINLFVEEYCDVFLDNAFSLTQDKILKTQKQEPELSDMKTTMVVFVVDKNEMKWGHIGDSRLYQFTKKKMVVRTKDHSVPQMLVNMGEIKEKDIRGHEDRNRLLRVIGAPWTSNSYEVTETQGLNGFNAFLLCSDGFWENIEEKKMLSYLKKANSVDEWLDLMIEEVNQNGRNHDMDNNSAIAVWVEE
ncbi:MAG: PP2C family protein-serine/threonine phosphatase [Wujia sp.]